MKDERSLKINTQILVSYAYGLLAPGVANQVKNALEADETLRWEYEGIQQLMKDFPDEDPEELLAQMSATIESSAANAVLPRASEESSSRSHNWLIAATILLIVIASVLIVVNGNRSLSAQQLAEEMIASLPANPYDNDTRGSLDGDTTNWKRNFAGNDFLTVISRLENKSNRSYEEQFFLAVAYLSATPPQPAAAEALLTEVSATENEFRSDAWLYLGLAQTLQNKKEAALESLGHVEQTAQVKALRERLRQ